MPHRACALERLQRVRPGEYARTRNHLQGAVTGLSPYLTHGLLTLPEVVAALPDPQGLPMQHKLIYELGWREFFRHVWAHRGDGIFESLHEGPLPETAYDRELPEDIRQGRTGLPVIDEAVRTLYRTGTLHNHARMWLASYVVHLRKVHWRTGADWLVSHLLDGDLASNHLSWQWVAGTGSSKPYLFNADNVAKFAPTPWHCPGTGIDVSYEALDSIARDGRMRLSACGTSAGKDTASAQVPTVLGSPPPELDLQTPDARALQALQGRDLWLVHPWALRAAPPGLPGDALVVGIYVKEYHAAWPWSLHRWQWVDAAMATVTPQRWWLGVAGLAQLVATARTVRTVADPHLTPWLPPGVQLQAPPALFRPIDVPCHSFSKWWNRASAGHRSAADLLTG